MSFFGSIFMKKWWKKIRFTRVRVGITILVSVVACLIVSYILRFANELNFGQTIGVIIATLIALLSVCVTAYVFVCTSADIDGSSNAGSDDGASRNPFRYDVLRLFQLKLGLIVVLVLVCTTLSLIAIGMPSSGGQSVHDVQNIISASMSELLPFDMVPLHKIGGIWSVIAVMVDVIMIVFCSSYVWAVIAYRKRMVGIALWQRDIIEDIFEKGASKFDGGNPTNCECSRNAFERVLSDILSLCSSRLALPQKDFDFNSIARKFLKDADFENRSSRIGWYIRFLERYLDACREADTACLASSRKDWKGNWKLLLPVAEKIWNDLLVDNPSNGVNGTIPVNVSGHDFSKATFRNARMEGSTFSGCVFSDNTDFTDANMSRCDFRGSVFNDFETRQVGATKESANHPATFIASRFDRVWMTNAKIYGNSKEDECPLSQSVFTDANLNGFRAENTYLNSCAFAKTLLYESSFCNTLIGDTEFVESRMTGAEFYDSELSNCNMKGSLLISTSWHSSHVANTSFEGASLIGAKIRSSNFLFAYCSRAIFQNSKITNSTFQQSMLNNADFTEAELLATKFIGTQIDGALFRFCREIISCCEFVGCSAINASFMGSVFECCIFKKSSLVSSSFQGCSFRNCRFVECDLKEVRFDDSSIFDTHFINCFNLDQASYGGTDFEDAFVFVQPRIYKDLSGSFSYAKNRPAIDCLGVGEWNDWA